MVVETLVVLFDDASSNKNHIVILLKTFTLDQKRFRTCLNIFTLFLYN